MSMPCENPADSKHTDGRFELLYLARCSKCHRELLLERFRTVDYAARHFALEIPDGWVELEGHLFCDRHRVVTAAMVDGEIVI